MTTLVIGEGGSGGALALAAPGNTWATAGQLLLGHRPGTRGGDSEAAAARRWSRRRTSSGIRPQDLVELGVIRGTVGP